MERWPGYRVAVYPDGRKWCAEVAYECNSGLQCWGGGRDTFPYEADGRWWMVNLRRWGRTPEAALRKVDRWMARHIARRSRDAARRRQVDAARMHPVERTT